MKRKLLILLAAALLFAASANAGVALITNPSALNADTLVDWSALGASYTWVPAPVTINTPSVSIGVSETGGGFFERRDQSPDMNTFTGWLGHFAGGAHLLWTQDTYNSDLGTEVGHGPMIFDFETPILGFLVQIQNDGGPPDYFLQAFAGGTDLGTFQVSKTFPGQTCCDNTSPFIGVLSDQANITRIVLSTGVDGVGNFGNDFAIDGPLIQTQAGGQSGPTVPEPSSVALFSAGMLGMTTLALRRRRG